MTDIKAKMREMARVAAKDGIAIDRLIDYGTRCATAGALAALEMEPGCRICNTAVNGVLAVCGHHALHRAAALKEES